MKYIKLALQGILVIPVFLLLLVFLILIDFDQWLFSDPMDKNNGYRSSI